MKCGDCKFFGDEIVLEDVDDDTGKDITIKSGYHKCTFIECIGTDSSIFYVKPKSKSVLVDGSAYMAAIRVREDFGCVEFIAKG